MNANSTGLTLFDENLAHYMMLDKSVTSHMYKTLLSPPPPSAQSPVAR